MNILLIHHLRAFLEEFLLYVRCSVFQGDIKCDIYFTLPTLRIPY